MGSLVPGWERAEPGLPPPELREGYALGLRGHPQEHPGDSPRLGRLHSAKAQHGRRDTQDEKTPPK